MTEQNSSFLLRKTCLWNHDEEKDGVDVLVKDGVVADISHNIQEPPEGITEIDAKNKILMPAGVDPQVHLRLPGGEHKELAHTGLAAARKGGILALLHMPNTSPVIDTPEVVKLAKETFRDAEKELQVKVLISAAVVVGASVKGRDIARRGAPAPGAIQPC